MRYSIALTSYPHHSTCAGHPACRPLPFCIPVSDIVLDLIEKQEHIETAARALKAISHPLRLKILCVIGDQEVCVQDIVEAVGTSQSNISQHLAILREKDVLQTRKDANRVYYRVADPRVLQLIGLMREVFCGVALDV
ncbi:MAG: metalloregulator ArsR/SmtB family transcription factor [Sterolibacterium sp.]|nr:metalloregulator ArsR/SmtB family transcription factor [Sterolibacterium sp.]